MATMIVFLPDEMKSSVETQAANEGFGTTSEYLRSVIRDVQKLHAKQALEAELRKAIESGPAEPMTREDWDGIETEGLERLARQQRAER